MEYITYKRFKGNGIAGAFNLQHGTKLSVTDGFLVAPDGRTVCAVTSENGWEHFRPNTPEGAYRQALLERLYKYYASDKGNAVEDFAAEKWPDADNLYWKNLLRTMPTSELTAFYTSRLGKPPRQLL